MSQQDLEKHIREQLQQYPSPVNPDAIWEQIADRVPKKKKRRIFGWWFFLGLGLLLTIGWFGYSLNTAKNHVQQQTTTNDKEAENQTISGRETSGTVPISKPQQNNADVSEIEKVISNPPPSSVTKRESSLIFNTNEKPGLQSDQFRSKGYTLQTVTPEKAIAPSHEPTPALSSTATMHSTSIQSQQNRLALLASLTPLTQGVVFPDFGEVQLDAPEILIVEHNEKRKKKTIRWSIGLEGGLSRPTRSLSASDSLSVDYRNLRQSTEELLEAVHLGFNTQIELPIGIYFRTGLSYTRINEKFEKAFTTVEQDTLEDGIQEIYIDINGDSTNIRGPVPFTRTTSVHKRTYNSLTLLDVPLIVGYRVGADRWSFLAEGGAYANLQLQAEGNIAADDDALINLSENEPEVFRANLGLSYHLGLGVEYNISPKLSLGAKANFRFFPQSFTVDNYALEQKYTLIGVTLGLKYYLK
ncbi:MAG: hypothetical protein DHS20C18_07310 [Saprospiraceae bacterium]|nr:MAG: hypothetical protein DHS20C18_07310 [Saprospiraceae bacterium]